MMVHALPLLLVVWILQHPIMMQPQIAHVRSVVIMLLAVQILYILSFTLKVIQQIMMMVLVMN